MIVAGQRLPIVVATRPVDFRCGHQALALIVQEQLKLDPHSGVTVIFRSKRGDRLKILVWETLLRKSSDGGAFPSAGQTYPTTFVTGMPRAVKPFRMATRTWTSAT